ncbi:hypothetical protein MKW98_012121 [Papaver atlanticum]|uniref:AAA+ ATPase domain-containing protein n=1 Tax=Papaver atlanticum TaxID=357466 RepID=A0AAD4TAZ0_9MAGN|nr:hypothetical protein MKW98_012121 [Papaver atlanticum]
MIDSPPPTHGDSSRKQLNDSSTNEADSATDSHSDASSIEEDEPWGELISLNPKNPQNFHKVLYRTFHFITEQEPDQRLIVFTLSPVPPEKKLGLYTALLEVASEPEIDSTVQVNGEIRPKDSFLVLEGEETLVFGTPRLGYLHYKFHPFIKGKKFRTYQCQVLKASFRQQILSSDGLEVSFESFPYYLSENTKKVLIAPALLHLKCRNFLKYSWSLPTLSSRILLSGPADSEIYQERLAKALAKHFGARLLIVNSLLLPDDILQQVLELSKQTSTVEKREPSTTFNKGDRVKFVFHPQSSGPQLVVRGPAFGYRGRVIVPPAQENGSRKVGVRFYRIIEGGNDLGGLCEVDHGYYCLVNWLCLDSGDDVDKSVMEELFEVVRIESERDGHHGLILFLKNIEEFLVANPEAYLTLKSKLGDLPEKVVVIGSHTQTDNTKKKSHPGDHLFTDSEPENVISNGVIKEITRLFPNKVMIKLPQDESLLLSLKKQLEQDVGTRTANSNIANIQSVLRRNGLLECPDLAKICIEDQALSSECAEKIVGWALAHRAMDLNNSEALVDGAKLVVSNKSIQYGLSLLKDQNEAIKLKQSLKDLVTENKFEKALLADVVAPTDIGIRFNDIGALETVKDTLEELVMLPLEIPELFKESQLTKPCKGILLFGPPGTGKTMLAKAVATEAGANFINISTSRITSKFLGDGEKYVKAVFSLASKIAPSVVFVDEVDSMLSRRGIEGEDEAMRRMKNEFMASWDGLCTKDNEQVLVLAATNRPFDLDEAIIRRFRRRLMVNLPDAHNRKKILRVILAKEKTADVDLDFVANMTDGYSGSDLKNLCETAARRPLREYWEEKKKKVKAESEQSQKKGSAIPGNTALPVIRPLNTADLKFAQQQVSASFPSDSRYMNELHQWNNDYGEGGSRKKMTFDYFV